MTSMSGKEGEFKWSQETRGLILGSFYYGYIITLIPAGWLAERIGGKNFFGGGIVMSSAVSLLTPVAAHYSVNMLIALRILEGLFQGAIYPSLNVMLSCWAPPLERSKMLVFSLTGELIGTITGLVVSGFLCASDFIGGWPSVFYVFGLSGILWFVFWVFLAFDSPSSHPRISTQEREYIVSAIGTSQDKVVKRHPTPWFAMMTSPATLAIAVTFFCSSWSVNTFLTSLPSYFEEVLHFNIKENVLLSALPYACQLLMSFPLGILADWLIQTRIISITEVRKVFTTASFCCSACIMVALSYTGPSDSTLSVVLLCLLFVFLYLDACGHWISPMEFAPRYAGLLFAIANTIGTITGIAAPFVVGYLTNGEPTRGQWQKVFYIAAGIYVFGALVFLVLGTSVEQPWNTPPEDLLIPVDLPREPRAPLMSSLTYDVNEH